MELKKYYAKTVEILATNGKKFRGIVSDYFHPDENDSGKESIVIDTTNDGAIEFYEKDISQINVI